MNNSDLNYLIGFLSDYGLSNTDITEFLTLVYNNMNTDLELVFSGTKYSDAFYQFSEEIYAITNDALIEWKNSLS